MDNKRFIAIGSMLFALFFGAGNLIFPAAMGQASGGNVGWALLGFCITGVGLPLLGIVAVGFSGCRDLREVASRVSPMYGLFYTVVCYMAIGPCFAIPRTGTVSYEIAVAPFLGPDPSSWALPIFLVFFLGFSYWLAASPSKLVDRIGKMLTPALLATLLVLIAMSFITPLGEFQEPSKAYATATVAAVQGVLDGYNTLDAIAALVFSTLVVNTVREAGVTDPKHISGQVFKAGFIAALLLAVVYIFIAKIGAESVTAIGLKDTGAPILAESSQVLFGSFGAMLLAVIVLLACLTTSVGLLTCCAVFFMETTGRLKYRQWVALFTVISYLIGLFGLKTIIVSTIPVLMFIYPLCVALIALIFLHSFFGGRQCVYVWTMGLTFVMALVNGIETVGFSLGALGEALKAYVPLHTLGLGWVPFAIVGFVIGLVWKAVVPQKAAAA
ncbi:branched-chain amino acid transport system II carrier protein [Sutterella sp.]|uniref:branched-chain amino acid transport system II carrier protein n=1 Tax=Sutterella sp. TaxID=1981025 RepID=UPI0026E0A797|nr:branched-chain amino acid transport system II carrier protein [Sutterella sp.]MDO5531499.1 branched-chain amino acid transport system II carrier protein [Sutterella sp.]